MAICARPNAVSLAASHFEGPGLTQCIAGERAEFIIQVDREPFTCQTRTCINGCAPWCIISSFKPMLPSCPLC